MVAGSFTGSRDEQRPASALMRHPVQTIVYVRSRDVVNLLIVR